MVGKVLVDNVGHCGRDHSASGAVRLGESSSDARDLQRSGVCSRSAEPVVRTDLWARSAGCAVGGHRMPSPENSHEGIGFAGNRTSHGVATVRPARYAIKSSSSTASHATVRVDKRSSPTRHWAGAGWWVFALTILAMCLAASCASGDSGSARSIPSSALGTAPATATTPDTASSTTAMPDTAPSTAVVPDTPLGGAAPIASDLAVAAINIDDATTRWTMPRSDDLRGVSNVIVGGGLVVVQSGFCDNNVATALDPATGAVLSRTDPSLPIDEVSRPPGVPGLVAYDIVTMFSSQRVVGLDTATGQAKWIADIGGLVAESESVMVVWSPVAGLIRVLDRVTGAELWTLRTNPPLPSPSPTPGPANPADLPPFVSAAADGERVYIRVDSEVTAHAATDGTRQWSTSVGPRAGVPAALLPGLDVLMTESNGGIVALDAANGRQRWSIPNNTGAEQLALNEARVSDGNLYLSLGSSVTAFDLATGKQRWQAPGTFPLAAGNGRVLLAGVGRMYLMDAATGTDLWSNTAANPQLLAGPAAYALDSDSVYLGWNCGGG